MDHKKNNIKYLLNDESFLRWINDNASPEERNHWERWLKSDLNNQRILDSAKKYLNLPYYQKEITEGEIGEQLHQLNAKIDNYEGRNKKLIKPFRRQLIRVNNQFFKYSFAAVIALIIGILAVIRNSQTVQESQSISYRTIHVSYGKHEILNLADGSEIILNANSVLKYPAKMYGNKPLNVWLNGEAYFSIVHNPNGKHRIFRVHTQNGVIRDLGTHFVVDSRKKSTLVVLVEGEVEVALNKILHGSHQYTKMKPGQLAELSSSTHKITLNNVDTRIYTSWIHNRLFFDNTSVRKAVQIIENYYGVKIIITDKNILDQKVSGTIKNTDLSTVLRGLSRILGLKVEHKNNIIIMNK